MTTESRSKKPFFIYHKRRYELSISPKQTVGAKAGTPLYRAEARLIFFEDQYRKNPDQRDIWMPKIRQAQKESNALSETQ